ncbi:MAG: S24/S26 family peptidase [Clostridia bacterium]|nr:S24/S26 family peptidase [Clostridia bacterium]
MGKSFSMKDLEPLIRETLEKGFTFTLMPRGTSMLPLIREGLDSVILSPLPEDIRPGDVILYKRDDGKFVLHRVIKKVNDTYTMCGDNQVLLEKGIMRSHMIAVATGIIRDGEETAFSENEEYALYTKKIVREKISKNRFTVPKRAVKKLLKKLHIIKKRKA